jgi:hypothetical protein
VNKGRQAAAAAPGGSRANQYAGGIADALRCVGMIRASTLSTRNRLAFLTLDSTLEISMRLFMRYRKNVTLDPVKHRRRHVLLDMVKKKLNLEEALWEQLTYWYESIRCPLYHEASDMIVSDGTLDDFQETVCFLLKEMFEFDASAHVGEGATMGVEPQTVAPDAAVDLRELTKVDAVVLALGRNHCKDASAIFAELRALGYTARLDLSTISAYLSRGGYFFKDPADGLWKLTEFVGKQRYRQITEVEK